MLFSYFDLVLDIRQTSESSGVWCWVGAVHTFYIEVDIKRGAGIPEKTSVGALSI
jgi:hypothetical protein